MDLKWELDEFTGCWEVISHKPKPHGYVQVKREGKNLLAHRMMYAALIGPIPEGLLICHSCDNRKCVNPEHLFLGSYKDNTQDMMKKGRHVGALGYRNGAKLKEKDLGKILWMLHCGPTQKTISKIFGIDPSTVSDINTGKTWKGVAA